MATTTTTKHKADCKMSFGRKDATCPRCQELLNGAEPRVGWHSEYFKTKKRQLAQRAKSMGEHNCTKEGCSVVCTAFDW